MQNLILRFHFSFLFISAMAMWIISPIMLVINSCDTRKSLQSHHQVWIACIQSDECSCVRLRVWQLETTIRRHRNVVTIANHLRFNRCGRIRWTTINRIAFLLMKKKKTKTLETSWAELNELFSLVSVMFVFVLYTIMWPLMPIYLSFRLLSHLANRA